MHAINLSHSLQGLDISLAILAQLRSTGIATRITSVLRLAPSMQQPNADFLFETVARISDDVVIVGQSALHDQAAASLKGIELTPVQIAPRRHVCSFAANNIKVGVAGRTRRKLLRIKDDYEPALSKFVTSGSVLMRSHADVDEIAQTLVRLARQRDGRSLVYLEGNYPPGNTIPLKYFSHPRTDLADTFLLYSETHAAPLASVGYHNSTSIGYPMFFPARKPAVLESRYCQEYQSSRRGFEVSLLTRGEQPDAQGQIMPNSKLREILLDIFDQLREFYPDVFIRLKPHPSQDVEFVRQIIGDRKNVSLVFEHPAQLAATSDLLITTWSTAVIEALVFDVPAIEYFVENEYFRSVYPNGSSFRELGILWAENREGFRSCLQQLKEGKYRLPDGPSRFGHEMNLNVFNTISENEQQGRRDYVCQRSA